MPTENNAETIVLLRRRKVPGSIDGEAPGGVEWMGGELSGAGLGGDTNGAASLKKKGIENVN